jgi:hypothetical protein
MCRDTAVVTLIGVAHLPLAVGMAAVVVRRQVARGISRVDGVVKVSLKFARTLRALLPTR